MSVLSDKNPAKVGDARQFLQLADLSLYRGGQLSDVTLAYETWGELNGRKDNAILIFSGLSPSAHAASSAMDSRPGWWEYMIGDNKPINSQRYFIICVNSLGSCFGSTGPASINPHSGKPYGIDFPVLSVEDIAQAAHAVVNHLGIEKLHTVLGASLGGMASLAYSIYFPYEYEHLVSISSAMSAAPYAIAIRSLQRDIIRSDPKWQNGRYPFEKGPREGIRLARKLGISTYRSPEEWRQRFGRKSIDAHSQDVFANRFEIESYLDYNARKFVDHFDANCYLYLSQAMDLFDVRDHGKDLQQAFAKIKSKSNLIIGVETDFLFPTWQQKELAEALLSNGIPTDFVSLSSVQGHDAFLVDEAHFAPVMRQFFQ